MWKKSRARVREEGGYSTFPYFRTLLKSKKAAWSKSTLPAQVIASVRRESMLQPNPLRASQPT